MLRGTLGGFATGVNVKTVPDTFSNLQPFELSKNIGNTPKSSVPVLSAQKP
jgi:hypothetical protein